MKLDVFGTLLEIERIDHGWKAFYPGLGIRKPATDIVIPPDLGEDELVGYIDDLCHEWATIENNQVIRLE